MLLGMRPQATPLVQGCARSREDSSLSPSFTFRCCPDPRRTLVRQLGVGGGVRDVEDTGARACAGGSGSSLFPRRAGRVRPPSTPHPEPRHLGASLSKAWHWWLRSHRGRSDTGSLWQRLPGSVNTCSVLLTGAGCSAPTAVTSSAERRWAGKVGKGGHSRDTASGHWSPVTQAATSSMKQGVTCAFPTGLSRSRWLPARPEQQRGTCSRLGSQSHC